MSPIETFEPEASSAAHVRRFVARTLSAWDIEGDDIGVVANELATNAILHGRTRFSVSLDLDGQLCRVEIADWNPRTPVLSAMFGDATSGHGLGLVDALSARWGVEARDGGKAVWCELTLDPNRRAARLHHPAGTSCPTELHGVR
jgi:hypothetical protein